MSVGFNRLIVRLCFLLGLLQISAFHSPALAAETIRIGGTGTGLGTMRLLGDEFEKLNHYVKVEVVPGLGGAGGILSLLQGTLDIAVSGSALNRDEKVSGVKSVEYARTPFVFVVHTKNVKSGVTTQELEKIYGGLIKTWPDGKKVRLVLRLENDTDSKIISSISPGMNQAIKTARSSKGSIIAVTDHESIEAIANTPGAIGTSTLTQIATEKSPLKVLTFAGAVPNLSSLSNGSYHLFKPLFLVTTSRTTPTALLFVDFVRSPQGARILSQSGNLVVGGPKAE